MSKDKASFPFLMLQHTGEVYGEKAILVTEVRELQSRVLSLSDERDKALAILDEVLIGYLISIYNQLHSILMYGSV